MPLIAIMFYSQVLNGVLHAILIFMLILINVGGSWAAMWESGNRNLAHRGDQIVLSWPCCYH